VKDIITKNLTLTLYQRISLDFNQSLAIRSVPSCIRLILKMELSSPIPCFKSLYVYQQIVHLRLAETPQI